MTIYRKAFRNARVAGATHSADKDFGLYLGLIGSDVTMQALKVRRV